GVNGAIHDLASPPPVDLAEHRAISVVLGRVVRAAAHRTRIAESVEAALREGGGQVEVEVLDGPARVFAEDFRCSGCGAALERPQPLLFSFNHPLGACPECKGFGNLLKYDEALVVPDPGKSLAEGAIEPLTHPSGKWSQRDLMKATRPRACSPTSRSPRGRRSSHARSCDSSTRSSGSSCASGSATLRSRARRAPCRGEKPNESIWPISWAHNLSERCTCSTNHRLDCTRATR